MVKKVIFLKDARSSGTSTWTVPADFSPVNTIHCIGGGGSGGNGGSDGAAGGGGGAYSAKYNVQLTPGSTVHYRVGIRGIAEEGDGGDTWFGATTYEAALCAARGGKNPPGTGSSNKQGGQGGQASEGIGDVRYSGGNSLNVGSSESSGSGGGGAAGPDGNGGWAGPNGGNDDGGHAAGSNNTGGTSSSPHGKMHPVWQETATGEWAGPGGGGYQALGRGGDYGGGGGGEGFLGDGKDGGQGIIVIEYEPVGAITQVAIVG